MRRRWIYKDGIAYEIDDADVQAKTEAGYFVVPDIQPYQSMVNGEWITSRSRHREHLREHGLSSNNEVGNDKNVLNAAPRPKAPPPGLSEALARSYEQAIERNRRR